MSRTRIRYWTDAIKSIPAKINAKNAVPPTNFIGQKVLAKKELDQPYEEVTIENVQGALGANASHLQKYFVINGTHFVSMFSFYTQLMEHRLPTEAEEAEFELATEIKQIKEVKDG